MAKAIMTCGRLCSGKSTYARKLQEENGAVLLSIDECMLTLFPQGAGAEHDVLARRTEQYLLSLSLQILREGTDVILDWGLWTREQRRRLRAFYQTHGMENEIHYLRVSDEEWNRRIQKRNAETKKGEPSSYYVDEGLLKKFEACFEEPSAEEVDRIIDQA